MTTDLQPSASEELALLAGEFAATIETLEAKGLHESAEQLARQMIEILPQQGLGWKALSYALLRRGDLAGALMPLQNAASLLPEDAEVLRHFEAARAMRDALALDANADYEAAGQCYETVLRAYPQHPDANHRLGVIKIRLLQPEASLPYLERALGENPNNLQYWANYLDGLVQSDQLDAAWIVLNMAQQRGLAGPAIDELIGLMTHLSTHPTFKVPRPQEVGERVQAATTSSAAPAAPGRAAPPQAASPAANHTKPVEPPNQEINEIAVLFNDGQVDEALRRAQVLTERYPSHGFGWKVVAASLFRLGRHYEAIAPTEAARRLWPNDIDMLQISMSLLEMKGSHQEAEATGRRLLELKPDHAEGLRLLAITLGSQGRLEEAEQCCRRSMEIDSHSAYPPCTLGVTLMQQGRLDDAAAMFRRSIELNPDFDMAYNNMAFCLTHSENVTPEALFAVHRGFAESYEAPLKPAWPQHRNNRDPQRRLRIGFISGDFCRHAVASFLEPALVHLSQDETLSLYAYSNTQRDDTMTAKLRTLIPNWREVLGAHDGTVVQMILADEIDILIDLAGHTGHNRLRAMAHKPAPIQASWIGYPGTTGLDAVDYFIADRFWVPSEHFSNQFSEKIAYLPALAAFQADPLCPPVNLLPALANGYVTFGSFNRMDKLRRDVIALWSRLLRELPNSRMLIGAMPRDETQDKLARWFAEEGISRDRLDFRSRSSVPVYLQQHHHVDFCLDSFPFSGLTTALHSLWMGVPTLTLPHKTVPGRSGLTAMSHVGLEQFIATDKDDFVRRGLSLVADLPALAELRATLRTQCQQSPMYRPESVAASLSQALRMMWQRWCDGLPAKQFEVAGDATPTLPSTDQA